jgi:two-component system NarL family sensor kinase
MSADIADIVPRLPEKLELVLFRAIQEALTNLHRHSGSSAGEVSLCRRDNSVVLQVRDYGKGIAQQVLDQFLSTGSGVGVGLAGMRERVREQGGRLDIWSDSNGTLINITIPMKDSVPATPANREAKLVSGVSAYLPH